MIHIFIVNPRAGMGGFSEQISRTLAERKDIEYYIFHTRKNVNEKDLVKQILFLFEGEKLRFYCCGGQGTLRNVLNGFDDLSQAEIAFLPMGLSNDFIKVFGDRGKYFNDINRLIDGEPVRIDYIRSNNGVCLNTFSVGLDANALKRTNDYQNLSVIGKLIPFTIGLFGALFFCKPEKYEIELDDKVINGKFIEVLFGNGSNIGGFLCFDKHADIVDGKAHCILVDGVHTFKLFGVAKGLVGAKKQVKHVSRIDAKKIKIKRRDGGDISINQDGELLESLPYWEAEIIHEGLSFVLPKGVEL